VVTVPATAPATTAAAGRTEVAAAPSAAPAAARVSDAGALERLKQALRTLVAEGSMSRDEAIAIWRKRIAGGG
jgi:hypothetical protein